MLLPIIAQFGYLFLSFLISNLLGINKFLFNSLFTVNQNVDFKCIEKEFSSDGFTTVNIEPKSLNGPLPMDGNVDEILINKEATIDQHITQVIYEEISFVRFAIVF